MIMRTFNVTEITHWQCLSYCLVHLDAYMIHYIFYVAYTYAEPRNYYFEY